MSYMRIAGVMIEVCVECLIGKQKKPILFQVTEPSSVPYRAPSACANMAARGYHKKKLCEKNIFKKKNICVSGDTRPPVGEIPNKALSLYLYLSLSSLSLSLHTATHH